MLVRLLFIFILFSAYQFSGEAQSIVIEGRLIDHSSDEPISFSTLKINSRVIKTDLDGGFQLIDSVGNKKIVIDVFGYDVYKLSFKANKDTFLSIRLSPKTVKTTVITANEDFANLRKPEMGKVSIDVSKIKEIPVLLGEVDIIKTLQLMPGIQGAGEGNSGFYVRGGGPDQNLVMLDGATVLNAGHLLGFFSVFNADAIANATLYKGGMPAEYGGRISSVLAIETKEANPEKLMVKGGIGVLSSRLSIETPIGDKFGFIASARRTYIDAVLKPVIDRTNFAGSAYYFQDFNAKLNYQPNDHNKIYFSTYLGNDAFRFKNEVRNFNISLPWGNKTATLRWNSQLSKKLNLSTALLYTQYDFEARAIQDEFTAGFTGGLKNYSATTDLTYHLNENHNLKTGVVAIRHIFNPGKITATSSGIDFAPETVENKRGNEYAAYIRDEWKVSDRIRVSAGIRLSSFTQIGAYNYVDPSNRLDTITYSDGTPVITYIQPEPRILFNYSLDSFSSLKAGYTVSHQFVHLVSSSGNTLPSDLWVPTSKLVKPQKGVQYALGYSRLIKDNAFLFETETWYKTLENQVEFQQNYVPAFGAEPEYDFVFGNGYSYGIEFLIKKNLGKLQGWIGYTLGYTIREFKDLNNGNPFPARYDRRHDVSLVANYEINDKWSASMVFVFGSGNVFTMPVGFHLVEGNVGFIYGDVNNYRMPSYHRLDISATYKPNPNKKLASTFTFAVYNLYSRLNPYFIYFATEGSLQENNLRLQPTKVAIFPILPSITWNFSTR